jgi:FkbM family methyltransferase
MVAQLLKRVAVHLPDRAQHELRRRFFARQIRARRFTTDEVEYGLLGDFLREGDWALDVGANVGHYAMRMSELVGANGRVIAFEPVPQTFALLSSNTQLFAHANVSLLNAAVSDRSGVVRMDIPDFAEGMKNYYRAHITGSGRGLSILTVAIDALDLPHAVALAKIDVEGHELAVLHGMQKLIARDHPVLIVETGAGETIGYIESMGYAIERPPGSSNVLCRAR